MDGDGSEFQEKYGGFQTDTNVGTIGDDYAWLSPTGELQLFRNIHSPPAWGEEGVIFNQFWPRKRVRIADIDGDGKADIIFLREDGTVAIWYKNEYTRARGFSFTNKGGIAELPPCAQRDGVGLFDLAVRFADLK
jgi:hypothetical protein